MNSPAGLLLVAAVAFAVLNPASRTASEAIAAPPVEAYDPIGSPEERDEASASAGWGDPETARPDGRGLTQLDAYLERLGLDEGVLVIFDRRGKQARSHTRFEQAQAPSGRKVTVLRA